jgi:hypothetical protein
MAPRHPHAGKGMSIEINASDKYSELGDRDLLTWARDPQGEWTEEFKSWFNGSSIKDKDGTPLIFYHGTNKDFASLHSSRIRELGFHFGSSAHANRRAQKEGARIFPVVLSIKNPLRVHDLQDFFNHEAQIAYSKSIEEAHCGSNDEICKINVTRKVLGAVTQSDLVVVLAEFGYDGIIYTNKYETRNGNDSVIAFYPYQVRSAITGEYLWME